MTEIQWLCEILTTSKLPPKIRDRFIARIGEITSQGPSASPQVWTQPPIQKGTVQQSPSTLAAMARQEAMPQAPIVPRLPIPSEIDKETGRAMVQTGNGTKGPRKF